MYQIISFVASHVVNDVKFVLLKLADASLTGFLNIFVRPDDVEKPVSRHFNSSNQSSTDNVVGAILSISGGNDNRKKKQEKRIVFKLGTVQCNGLHDFLLFDWIVLFISSVLFDILTYLLLHFAYINSGHLICK